jgi:hypothetical protein
MKKSLSLFIFLLLVGFASEAQRTFFIYLQSEAGQPFYVKMGEQVYSSTGSGYLILPQMKDSTYVLNLGFARSTKPESVFQVGVNGKDRGFLLKELQGTLQLFDLQTMSLQKPVEQASRGGTSYRVRDNAFTRLLSQASNDSTLFLVLVEAPVEKPASVTSIAKADPAQQKAEEPKLPLDQDSSSSTASVTATPKADTVAVQKSALSETETIKPETSVVLTSGNTPVQTPPKIDTVQQTVNSTVPETPKTEVAISTPDTVASVPKNTSSDPAPVPAAQAAEEYKRSVVTRRSESSTTEGFGLVFLDNDNGQVDTIRILIPNPKVPFRAETPASTKENKNFLDVSDTDTAASAQPAPVQQPKASAVKAECGKLATENDFLKLRKNMAAEELEDGMIAVAKKAFNARCFSTQQVKNLSALFLTNSGKYHFFDAAYPHVSDPGNFPSLQEEIRDEYFLKRFKALIGQ